MRRLSFARQTLALVVLAVTAAHASASQSVEWSDLIDVSAQSYEDPYRDLSYTQLDTLRDIVIDRAKIEKDGLSEEEKTESLRRVSDAKKMLVDDGIDADWLIAQRWIVAERRERAATAANPELDGQVVTLFGFAIPAPSEPDGTRIVYLVPERGMCSHMPPPNANQMIRARVSGDWDANRMHEPVRLTGTLSIDPTNHIFRVVDGEMPMRASFSLDVTRVETLEDLRADMPKASTFGGSLRQRLRAMGRLPRKTEGN